MPITLKHSGNAAPALVGAYAGGEGERGAHDAPVLAQLYGQRAAQTSKQASAMMSQLKQSADARQQAFINRAHKRMDDRQARLDAIENRNLNRQWALEDRAAMWDHENSVYERNQQGIRDQIEWRVTAEQKAKFEQLEKGYQDAVASGEYDEGELADIKRQVRSQQYGLALPRPKLRETPDDMAEEFAKSTYTDPSGNLWGRRRNGDWNLLMEAPQGGAAYTAPQLSWQDYSRLYGDLAKTQVQATDANGEPILDTDPDTGIQTPRMRNRTPGEIQDEIARRWNAWSGTYAPKPQRTSTPAPDAAATSTTTTTPAPNPARIDSPEALESAWSATLESENANLADGIVQPLSATPPASTDLADGIVLPLHATPPVQSAPAEPQPKRELVTLSDGSPGIRLPDGTEVPWIVNRLPPPSLSARR